ncbi:MAG: alpha/beta fold hydrolase [Marmoricola sp.]
MFVLVHGAGMGASCWDRLLPHLARPSIAVDLPGRGSRADVPIALVNLDDCAEAILDDVAAVESDDLVLVAHSFAGVSVPRVMAKLAPRLRHVVFLSAVVPPDATSVLDQIDPAVQEFVRAATAGGVYSQDREGARLMLCNDMDAEQSEWTLDRVVDDSAALLTEQVDLSGLSVGVPRTYIRLTKDDCYSPELQGRSAKRVGGEVRYLHTGHMAMVSAPHQVAEILNALA